jgi:acetyl-CoA carboxylase biotin carboxyl carrier protein
MGERKPAIDTGLVKDLAKILNETELTEIEIEQGELRIRVSRETSGPAYVQAMTPHSAPPAPPPAHAPQPSVAHQPASPAEARSGHEIPSPMVGTAYLAASPGSAPFIEVGQTVKEGQTLLIIEAMKTMNQIPSPRSGTITEILVTDSEPVEYGQTLVVIN